jgi:hypothetical protein
MDSTPPNSVGGPSMSKFKGIAQGFLAQAAASMKNFLPENKKLHITRVTDVICEMKPNTEDETFLYLDPKIKAHSGEIPRQRSPFREAIVFVIGGGNYNEYHNLVAYAKVRIIKFLSSYGINGLDDIIRPNNRPEMSYMGQLKFLTQRNFSDSLKV